METEFQNAAGKGIGEVIRDIADFLSMPYVIGKAHPVELCSLIEGLNMHGQFSFALLSEARAQGWSREEAESFYRRACLPLINDALAESMLSAFRDPGSALFFEYERKYGNSFSALDGSYWATVLSVAIDADEVEAVMRYLRLFTIVLMEFAYMEERNPTHTYAWCYFESFRKALESFAEEPETPLPLKIGAIGGSTGKREGEAYPLSLGVDVRNPNPDKMARGVSLDITLKDKSGKVIATVGERIESIDPDTVYHFALTKKLRGEAIASISATAKASAHLSLSTPIMNHISFEEERVYTEHGKTSVLATMKNNYDTALSSLTVHYQLLSDTGRILGGGSEWLLGGLAAGEVYQLHAHLPTAVEKARRVVFSVDFDALTLVN